MEKIIVGVRFSPTGEELINYYLKNKILDKPWLVDDAINEINICTYDPEFLPAKSKLESKDLIWYFFTPREYHVSEKKKGTRRTTPSGFWKSTGVDRKIKDKRGNGVEIGIKKTLVYYEGKSTNCVWTPWVMHEYRITCLPPTQRNYVICKVKYKGDSLYGNNSNELSHTTMVSDLNTVREINTAPQVDQPRQDHLGMSMDDLPTPTNEQDDPTLFNTDAFLNDTSLHQEPQIPWDDEYLNGCLSYTGGNFDDVLGDLEDIIVTQGNRNDHRPKKALTGTFPDYSSDSNAESISATSYQETSSPDSFYSLSGQFHTSVEEVPSFRDVQSAASTLTNRKTGKSRRSIRSKLEVKEGKSKAVDASISKKSSSSAMVKTEKKGWFITEEAMDRRNRKSPRCIYLMNMIICFILLMAVISNIISALIGVST